MDISIPNASTSISAKPVEEDQEMLQGLSERAKELSQRIEVLERDLERARRMAAACQASIDVLNNSVVQAQAYAT